MYRNWLRMWFFINSKTKGLQPCKRLCEALLYCSYMLASACLAGTVIFIMFVTLVSMQIFANHLAKTKQTKTTARLVQDHKPKNWKIFRITKVIPISSWQRHFNISAKILWQNINSRINHVSRFLWDQGYGKISGQSISYLLKYFSLEWQTDKPTFCSLEPFLARGKLENICQFQLL